MSREPSRASEQSQFRPLSRQIRESDALFLDVLRSRRSATGCGPDENDLASLLWHVTTLRERNANGRFGLPWESRPCPSAGGLHTVRIIVLPIETLSLAGEYLRDKHALAPIHRDALSTNASSIKNILGVTSGTTLQLACDADILGACYDNPESLALREAGALAAVICLTATALGLTSVMVGRLGNDILSAARLDARLVGVGAVHIGCEKAH